MTAPQPNWLHVYPAALWHDDVAIVGSAQALRYLAERLIEAADSGVAVAACCAGDGEGYWLNVVRLDELQDQVIRGKLLCPYVDELAGGPITAAHLPNKIQARINRWHEQRKAGAAP